MVKPETKPTQLPSPFKAPGIAERLQQAKSTLAGLQHRHKLSALDSINGAIGNDLATVKAEIKATLAEIEDLTAAHAAALDADEEYKRREFAELHKSEIRSVRQHLLARDKAATALSKALTDANTAFRMLVDQSQKARASVVLGSFPTSDVYTEFSKLKALVEGEIFRIGGDRTIGNSQNFPGARCHDHRFLNQPAEIKPLVDTLAAASDYLLKVLQGKAGVE